MPSSAHRVALAAALSLLLLAPAAAAGAKARRPSGKSLAETVGDAAKIAGLVVFYRAPDKLYLELPAALEGEPLGFSASLVGAAGDYAMRGSVIDTQVVRWRRLGDHLLLAKENLDFRAGADSGLAPAVEAAFADSPVFQARLVPLTDAPERLLIDATGLFGPGLAQVLPPKSGFTADAKDAVLVSLRTFPDNVVARVSFTLRRAEGGAAAAEPGDPFARFLRPGRLPDQRSAEIVVDYNFYRLPDDGYVARFADERIGAMTLAYKDYSDVDARDTLFRHLVLRWDVRKADPQAAVSPAAEPITFYLDHSVPEKWRPLVRDAALWWNAGFEKVGIRDAVRVLDPPDDPEWDPADVRHSMIFWNLADDLVFSGSAGPSVFDPRTGKVLKANVYLNGEFFSFALNRYLVYAWWRAPEPGAGAEAIRARREALRTAAASPGSCSRAASFSSQMAFARLVLLSRGELRPGTAEAERYAREAFLELAAHEVGHALGFPHNWKASLVSRWDDVRTGKVSGKSGPSAFSTSVMDYDPIYLAPRGAVQGDFFLQGIGAYDELALEYMYRPLEQLPAAEQEAALARIAARAESSPGLTYDDGGLTDIDPTTNSDDLGDDPLAFAESRLQMIHDEVLPHLPQLVLGEGHDYNLLRQALDSAIFSVAMDYVDMAARQVGGQVLLRRVARGEPSAGPPPVTPVPAATQRRALDVLARQVFADGAFALSPESMALLKADLLYDWNYPWRFASDYDLGGRIAGLYESALSLLLDPERLARVLDNERRAAAGVDRFTLPELFSRLERVAFERLEPEALSADRRALQRVLLAHLSRLVLTPERRTPAEASQLAAVLLASIRGRAASTLAGLGAEPSYARAHLADVVARATRTLEAHVALTTD